MAIVVSMSQRTRFTASGRPLRNILLITLVIGIGLALRAALADKGGTYDPAASPR